MKTITVFLLGLCIAIETEAIERTWTRAGGDDFWSNPNNWSPVGVPQDGDDLNFERICPFPLCPPMTVVNDLSNLHVGRLKFGGSSGEVEYIVNGNSLILTEWVLIGEVYHETEKAVVTLNCGLVLGTTVRFQVSYGGWDDFPYEGEENRLFLNGAINLNGHDLEIILFRNQENSRSRVDIAGTISGVGNLLLSAQATCIVAFNGSADNTFSGVLNYFGESDEDWLLLNKTGGAVTYGQMNIDGRVRFERDHQIGDIAFVRVTDSGRLFLQGHDETIYNLELLDGGQNDSGVLVDTQGGTLTVLNILRSTANAGTPTFRGHLGLVEDLFLDIHGTESYGLRMEAVISGANTLTKTGPAPLLLSGDNTFTGAFIIESGTVEPAHANAFGAVNNGVFLEGGALRLNNIAINGESLFCNDDQSALLGLGTSTWGGEIRLQQRLDVYGENFTLSRAITGTGGLFLLGGTVTLSGAAQNTFTGDTEVRCELLQLNKSSNVRAFSGLLTVGGSASPLHEVRWLNNFQLPPGANITVHDNGLLSLNDFTDSLGNLNFYGGRVNLAADSALTITAAITSNPSDVSAVIDGATGLGGLYLPGQRTFNVGDGLIPAIDLRILARLASGGITKIGEGTLALGGNNLFGGSVIVNNGIVRVDHDNGLGSASAGTTVNSGGTLFIATAPDLVREPVTLNGTGFGGTNGALSAAGAVTLSNNVLLATPSTIRVDSPGQFTIHGVISGTGPLTKIGSGALTLAGTTANTFSGNTLVNAGTLQLDKTDFVQAVPGSLMIGSGGFLATAATVRHFSQDQIWSNVTVNAAGLLDLNGYNEYLGTLTLNGGGDVQTGAGLLTLFVGNTLTVDPGPTGRDTATISGRLGLRIGNHQINVSGFNIPPLGGGPELDIPAAIEFVDGLANLHKHGAGSMRLRGPNTFTGALYVNAGRVTAAHNSALGTTQASTIVQTNGTLVLDGGVTVGEFLILDTAAFPSLISASGSNTVNNGINLLRPSTGIEVQPASGYLQVLGRVGSIGGLTKLGPGTLQFGGSIANTYAGLTIVSNGVIEAGRANLISIPGDALIGDDSTNDIMATIRSRAPGRQFRSSADFTVHRSGLLELGAGFPGSQETLNTVRGSGRINLGLASSLNISNDVSFELAAAISGAGALNKYRTNSSLHITADSVFTGPTTIFEGDCRVDGSIPNSAVTIKRDAALRGDGQVGNVVVEAGGIVNPNSQVPGHLGADLQMNSVNFLAGGILGLAFYGPHPTGGNDSLLVNNAVTLNNTRFSGGFQYAPSEGETITLVHKTAPGAVSGTFNNWPEGATRLLSDIPVTISYTGGNGNDITFTVTNLALRAAGFRLEGGNGDSFVDRDECNLLWLGLQNRRNSALTITHAELRSLTGAGMVTIAHAAYPNVPAMGTVTNLTPFQFSTTDALNCIGEGASVELQVTVTGEGTFAVPFILPTGDCSKPGGGVCETCTIVAGQFTSNALQTIRVPAPISAPSECLPAKPCPGAIQLTEGVRYIAHTFTNTTSSDACITTRLHYDCPTAPPGALIVAAYLDAFTQHAACAEHIGDAGEPLTNGYAPFSFKVPAGASFEVVVMQFMDVPACPDYSLELYGLPCPRPTLHIARDTSPDNVLLQWSTAYPAWHLQFVNALGDAFQNLPATPAIVNSRYTVTNTAAAERKFYRLNR